MISLCGAFCFREGDIGAHHGGADSVFTVGPIFFGRGSFRHRYDVLKILGSVVIDKKSDQLNA